MIVRNESRFLADCLASVQGVVDEICIVDTGSTDDTIAIARSFGARIEEVPWRDDFAFARNAALAMATRPWILVLDADERLAPRSRDELIALGRTAPDGLGRWIWCRNLSDPVREISASTNAIVRIFPNDPAVRYRGRLHEFVGRGADPGSLPAHRSTIEILHYGYEASVMAERRKGERNLRMSRLALEADPNDPTLLYNFATSAQLAGERDLARTHFERVVALTAGTPRGYRPQALVVLAGMYIEDGLAPGALQLADECVAIVPTLPDAHYTRGRALAVLGRLAEARAAFERAIVEGQRPGDHFVVEDEIATWKAHNELAGTLVKERRFAEARDWLERALANRPAERTLMENHANCCEALGDLPAALRGFKAAFDTLRDEPASLAYVNFIFRHGPPEVCAAAVDQALPFVGDDYRCMFLGSAAAVMLRAGRRDEACDLLRRVDTVRDDLPAAGGIVTALGAHYGVPELRDLLTAARNVEPAGGSR